LAFLLSVLYIFGGTYVFAGLDIPGILTIGPSFQVATELDGEVDVSMDMTVGINFNVNDAQLAFPPSDSNKPLASAFSIGDTRSSLLFLSLLVLAC
jgi:hypothetical protein